MAVVFYILRSCFSRALSSLFCSRKAFCAARFLASSSLASNLSRSFLSFSCSFFINITCCSIFCVPVNLLRFGGAAASAFSTAFLFAVVHVNDVGINMVKFLQRLRFRGFLAPPRCSVCKNQSQISTLINTFVIFKAYQCLVNGRIEKHFLA
jgi:hypothetical protein